jgi:CBS domain containing-hemolysin-like protein
MTPRSELYAIEVTTPAAEVMERVLESPYSRVPVYEGTLDNVIGAVNAKDVAGSFAERGEVLPLAELLRPIPFVPETMGAHPFVRLLQEQQSSKAIVVDVFGRVQGIISIEDVLTQLFGDIGDELKQPEPGPEQLADGSVRLPGDIGLDEAEPWLGVRWQGQATTVGGHVVAHLGRLPVMGERLEIDGVEVTVREMGPTTVRWVVVQPRVDAGEAHGEDAGPGERG